MKIKWLFYLILIAGIPVSALWFVQGCSQKVPTLATMAVNPSPTVCGSQSVYTFTNGPGCWQVDTGTNGAASSVSILSLGSSSAVTLNHPESLQIAVTNTGASRDAEIVVNFSPAMNLSAKQMIVNLYVGTTLSGMAVQPFDFSPSFEGKYTSVTAGTWVPVTFVFGSNGGNPNNVSQMGLQFKGIPASVNGDIYVDSVSIISYVTPTPTPIQTPCVFQALYTFIATPGCWQVDTGTYGATSSAGLVTLSISNTVTDNYSGSLQAAITNTGAARDGEINVNFSPTVNMDSKEMVMLIYASPSLAGMAVQPYAFSPGFQGHYTSITTGAWVPVSLVFSGSSAAVNQMGLQFKSIPASVTGDVWVDSVSILSLNTPTPTVSPTATISPTATTSPTPTFTPVLTWDFESSTLGAAGNGIGTAVNQTSTWYDNGGGTVTGVISWANPGYNSSSGCLNTLVTFTAGGQNEQIAFTPPSNPWDLSATGLNVAGLSAEIWMDSSLDPSGFPGAQISVSSGSSSHWEQAPYASLTVGTWQSISYNFTWSGGGAANDVQSLWIQVDTGNSDTNLGSGNIKLDNIVLY